MKALFDVEHHHVPTGPAPTRAGTTLRLGLVISVVAALLAVVARAVVDAPTLAIVIPVVVVAFALSWHAAQP